MASGTCAICDTEARVGDRCCRACGADLEVLVIDLGSRDEPSPGRTGSPVRSGPRSVAALLAGLVLLGATTWWLLADDGPTADDAAAPASVARPTATGADSAPPVGLDGADEPADRRAGPALRTEASASGSGSGVVAVDPTQLPDVAATHLAVAGDRRLYLLDLTTGDWSWRDVQNTPSSMHGVGGGVVMTGLVGGRLAFAPADGGALVALGGAQNELLRIDDRGVVVRRWSASPPDIVATTFDGERRWSYRPPPGMEAIGATSLGEVIVQAGETIIGIDPSDGTTRPIIDGAGFGVSADLLVVWRCDAELLCRTDQVDLDTSESRILTDAPIQLEPAGDEVFRGWVRGGSGRPYAYRLVDGWLERFDNAGHARAATTGAFDRTGVTVSPEESTLVFRAEDGTVLAAIESPVGRGLAKVALIEPGVAR
jgi:hypothetical protein